MENIFKNKLLIVLVLFVILLVSMCSNVLADTEYPLYNQGGSLMDYKVSGFSPSFEGNEDSFIIYNNCSVGYFDSSEYYLFISSRDSGTIFLRRKSDNVIVDNSLRIDGYNYTIDNENHLYCLTSIRNSTYGSGVFFSNVFTTKNIVNENGDVVFQGAPQEQEEITNPTQEEEITNPVVQVELMKPTQVQEILPQIMAVVGIVLPMLLTIFGVLLVLYLIKSKNLLHL